MTVAWEEWEGQVVDAKFRLLHYLGGSERAAVFLTECAEQGLPKAAIKLIPESPGDADLQLSRWKLAAALSHPHLIRLFQVGRCQLGGVPLLYVVMEYAEENLSEVLPQRPLSPEEARDMLQPALAALAFLHGQGFVHGQIKPANIMAVGDQLKLASDSICRIGQPRSGRAVPGIYDAPELPARGVSPAGDVWSLGVTLVEALTQHLPAWERPPQADPEVPPTLPQPFFDIARHCLRCQPQRRWSLVEIGARLQPPPPMPPVCQLRRPATPLGKFRKSQYFLPAVGLALGLLAMVVVPWLLERHAEAPPIQSTLRESPGASPKPQPKPAAPETELNLPKASAEKPSSGDAAASPGSVRLPAPAKSSAGGSRRGAVSHQVVPDVPQKARDTIQGTVRVRVGVAVDSSGRVTQAELVSPGPSKYFAKLALQAARQWQFSPPSVDGRNVQSEWVLHFEFTRAGTTVSSSQKTP
jgi:TonB family protein